MSRATIIIPARYASTRFPGKPLAKLKGASGQARTLLERTVLAARKVDGIDAIYVATDDARIAAEAERLGAAVVMTSESCRNGTERVAEAATKLNLDSEVLINLQGDAPLTPPWFVSELLAAMLADPSCQVATPILRCDVEAIGNFLADRKAGRVGATTVVVNAKGNAMYFSKEVIPFTDGRTTVDGIVPVFHHVGLYAYRRSALEAYRGFPVMPLEKLEGLEQLRFLEMGWPIRAVEVEARGHSFWELNNPQDIPLIENYLAKMGID
ncbi:3-deoxy-manno-octulosonate cytidylyltransferase [Zavarzinia sp.]|uniref:3-deoxy-manno-octulosonate cytidylyltransferase n=1 Tax=Zavarzinia sp. TaxID=2027920 RepID=UPI00356B6075